MAMPGIACSDEETLDDGQLFLTAKDVAETTLAEDEENSADDGDSTSAGSRRSCSKSSSDTGLSREDGIRRRVGSKCAGPPGRWFTAPPPGDFRCVKSHSLTVQSKVSFHRVLHQPIHRIPTTSTATKWTRLPSSTLPQPDLTPPTTSGWSNRKATIQRAQEEALPLKVRLPADVECMRVSLDPCLPAKKKLVYAEFAPKAAAAARELDPQQPLKKSVPSFLLEGVPLAAPRDFVQAPR